MDWVLCQIFPKKLVSFSTWIDHTRWARNTWAMAAIIILTMADIMDMVSMPFYHKSLSVQLLNCVEFNHGSNVQFSVCCTTTSVQQVMPIVQNYICIYWYRLFKKRNCNSWGYFTHNIMSSCCLAQLSVSSPRLGQSYSCLPFLFPFWPWRLLGESQILQLHCGAGTDGHHHAGSG